jgi:PAS domain S-box-containing protein
MDRAATAAEGRAVDARFCTFFDQAPIGKCMTAPDGRLLRVNPALRELLGRTAGELERVDWVAITHPDDVAESRECVRALLAGERDTYRMEKRYLRPDGSVVWALVTTRLLRDGEGAPLHFLTHILDIDDRKRAERELEVRNRIAEAFLTLRGDAVFARVLALLRDALASRLGLFGTLDEEGALVVRAIAGGAGGEVPDGSQVFPRASWGEGLFARAIGSRTVLRANEREALTPVGPPVDRSLAAPIVHQGEVLGLFLVAERAAPYDAAELALAGRLAAELAPILSERIAHDRLRASEERLARAQRIAALGQWEWDPVRPHLRWSDEIYAIFGLPRDAELSFDGIVARIHPDDRARNQAFVDAILARDDRAELELRVVTAAGELKHVHQQVEVERDADGRARLIRGTMQDISALRRAEARLAESELRFRSIFDELTDGVLCADPATHALVLANRSIARMLGRSVEELLALRVEDLHPAAELPRVLEAFERQLRGVQPLATDIPLLRRDGSVLFVDVNATPISLDGQARLMGVFRDATERRALQARLAQQDRLASMGLLAAGVAHEINNPLSYVLYHLESLAEELPAAVAAMKRCRAHLDPEALARVLGAGEQPFDPAALEASVERARDALEGTRRIRAVARTLSTFSRVEPGELALVSLHDAVEHAIRMAFNEIRFRARLVKDFGRPPPVLASEGKLAQVFLNLLLNAAHAIEEGDLEGNEIHVRTYADADGRAVAEVSDTGCGIAPEHLGQIFEPFFSTKGVGAGSGLGLPVSRHLVESFGGTIDCTTEARRGSCFRVVLPAGPAIAPPRPTPTPAGSPAARRGRILVVDDEPGVRDSLARMLAGHETVLAATGSEARRALEREGGFDLVVCDLMMPGLSGMELHAWLAERDARLAARMVFMTGGAFTPKASEFLARVANVRLEKPLDARLLRGVVDALLAGREEGSGS